MTNTTTTNFNEWLDPLELRYWGDIESLADSVSTPGIFGMFTTKQAPNASRWFVTADDYECTLMLATEVARDTFMTHIDNKYCSGEGISSWCATRRAMEKDD